MFIELEHYKNKYRIPANRLNGWDYGSAGFYFVTICTKDKQPYFGNIISSDNGAALLPTQIGSIAYNYWIEIPKHFPFVELDEFVIMPDHVHGVLLINNPEHHAWKPNQFGPQSMNLPSIIRGYKASVKKHANTNNIPFDWQTRYYDRIIRNENELQVIRQYIINNPMNWLENKNDSDAFLSAD